MGRLFVSLLVIVFSFSKTNAQLLSWAPAFAKDNDNIVITLDATKGNQGLLNYGTPNEVYVHTGVITNLSTSGTTGDIQEILVHPITRFLPQPFLN